MGARFGVMEGEQFEGDEGPDLEDTWADELIERARAKSAAHPESFSGEPVPNEGHPPEKHADAESKDTDPGLPTMREPTTDHRPPLVTFEDLHGSSASVLESPPEVSQAPAPRLGQPDLRFISKTPAVGSVQQVDLGLPGPRHGLGKVLFEWGSVIVAALAMALLVKAFLFQAFYIPSPSMEPTLDNGDRIIVNKLSYRLHDVNRGDVVVFKDPQGAVNGIEDLIKRVVALPGETISTEAGRVLINGGLLLEPYLISQDLTGGFSLPPGCQNPTNASDGCLVPPGHVFVLGDNRTNSKDGRFFGPIPEGSIIGRAFLRVWPLNDIGRL